MSLRNVPEAYPIIAFVTVSSDLKEIVFIIGEIKSINDVWSEELRSWDIDDKIFAR